MGILFLYLQNAGAMLRVSTPVPHELFGGTVAVLSTGESVLFSPTLAVKHTLVSTTLGATGAALSGLVLSKVMIKVFDVCFIVNCLLGYVIYCAVVLCVDLCMECRKLSIMSTKPAAL